VPCSGGTNQIAEQKVRVQVTFCLLSKKMSTQKWT